MPQELPADRVGVGEEMFDRHLVLGSESAVAVAHPDPLPGVPPEVGHVVGER
jgi:hypothetical protein